MENFQDAERATDGADAAPRNGVGAELWGIALVVAAAGAALSVLAWHALVREQHELVLHATRAHASHLAEAIESRATGEVMALESLAAFWARFGRQPRAEWERDAELLLEHHPALRSVAWIDAAQGETWIAAAPDAAHPPLEDPALASQIAAAAEEAKAGRRFVGDPFASPGGGVSCLVALPVTRPGETGPAAGALVALARLDHIVETALAGRAPGHAVTVSWGERVLLRRGEPSPELRGLWWSHALPLPLPALDASWSLLLEPTAALAAQELTRLPDIVLVGGLVISALLATLAATFQVARRRARRLEILNRSLLEETARARAAELELRQLNQTLEERVDERTAELGEAVADLEAFNYSVSHDLRSPLGAIANLAAILEEDCGEAIRSRGASEYLDRIRSSADNALAMMDALLAFSRLGREQIERAEVDMTELARSTAEELRAAEPGGERFDVKIAELPPARGDARMLRVVFVNLLSNALKFSRGREAPRVRVGAHEADRGVVYSIEDNGVGFDMRFGKKLFRVFERLHSSDEFEGHGVGLAIASRVVRRHGGRIWAEAETGSGARFSFTIPHGRS